MAKSTGGEVATAIHSVKLWHVNSFVSLYGLLQIAAREIIMNPALARRAGSHDAAIELISD